MDFQDHIYTPNGEHKFDLWRGSKYGYKHHVALVTAVGETAAAREEIAKALCVALDERLRNVSTGPSR